MSYRLQTGEPLSTGVRRVAKEQIDDALAQLTTPEDDVDEAIHEARKDFKKVRGLLRLIRDELGEDKYKRENVCFRDAGRLLSDLRDAAVRVATLDDVVDTYDDLLTDDVFASAREKLVERHKRVKTRTVTEENALTEAVEMITQARIRVDDWPVDNDDYETIAPGLRRIYKRGHKRLAKAEDNPSVENLHEWRKRVKYLWYNTRLLRHMWNDPLDTRADEIHDLSDYLGDDHDLAMLRAAVANMQLLADDTTARDTLCALLEKQQQHLQAQAMPLGRRIYVEDPDDFVARHGRYWQIWRSETPTS